MTRRCAMSAVKVSSSQGSSSELPSMDKRGGGLVEEEDHRGEGESGLMS